MSAIEVDPHRCRVWSLHPRLNENLTQKSCNPIISSFEKHGQLVPVLGRRLRDDPDHDIEIIYGTRRLFAARHLGISLQVEVRDLSDREALIALDSENRLHVDLTPYERALGYACWISEGRFRTQAELARALQVPTAQVSRLLKLTRLPEPVIKAFANPADIREAWGVKLATLIARAQTDRHVLEVAREIAASDPRPAAQDVFAQLCAAARAGRTDDPVLDTGVLLQRLQHQEDASVVFNVPLDQISRELLTEIEEAVARIARQNGAVDESEVVSVTPDGDGQSRKGRPHLLLISGRKRSNT